MSGPARTVLLGPQRFRTTVSAAVDEVAPDGPVVTVTAGWRDREGDDAELDGMLSGRSANLRLFARLTDVLATDPHFRAAALAHRDALDELAAVYSSRLQRSLESVYAVQRRSLSPRVAESAVEDGVRAVRAVDAWYLAEVDARYAELAATAPPEHSEPVARHREEVGRLVAEASAVAIAGGHVGMLLRCLKLFDVTPAPEQPVVAWSAGAMALTDTVVLYHDRGPAGVVGAEVWDRGLGRVPGVVAMPHARRRLVMDDPATLQVLVRRFAPATCLLLDDGVRVDPGPDGSLPDDARVLTLDGTAGTVGAVGTVATPRTGDEEQP